jgi:osmoprotectant transport system permease protein
MALVEPLVEPGTENESPFRTGSHWWQGNRFLSVQMWLTPLVIGGVWLLVYFWVAGLQLDSIEQRTLNADYLLTAVGQHLRLTFVATVLVILLAIPLGIVLSRTKSRTVNNAILGAANIGQAAPAIGVLALLTIIFGVGFWIAIAGLVAYTVLPVLRNTLIGIQQVDPALTEAATGMGMTPGQILRRVELPLAVPVILAGLRTALVFCVGVATLATFVSAGGLGDIIVNGIKLQRAPVLIVGSVLTAGIALLIDWLGGVAEQTLRPKGV